MRPRKFRRRRAALALLIIVLWLISCALVATRLAAPTWACDPGQYYDPSHQICQGSAPAYPRSGYGPWQNNYPGFPQSPPPGGWGQ